MDNRTLAKITLIVTVPLLLLYGAINMFFAAWGSNTFAWMLGMLIIVMQVLGIVGIIGLYRHTTWGFWTAFSVLVADALFFVALFVQLINLYPFSGIRILNSAVELVFAILFGVVAALLYRSRAAYALQAPKERSEDRWMVLAIHLLNVLIIISWVLAIGPQHVISVNFLYGTIGISLLTKTLLLLPVIALGMWSVILLYKGSWRLLLAAGILTALVAAIDWVAVIQRARAMDNPYVSMAPFFITCAGALTLILVAIRWWDARKGAIAT